MKLIIQNTRIVATATDDYTGPDEKITAPPDFDASRMGEYVYADGVLSPTTQELVWERIKAHRDYLSENGGYKVSVGGVDKWFHSDAKSKTQQLSLVLLGANANAVPAWKTMDGTKVTMSQNLAGQIFGAAVVQDGALFAQAEAHRAAMVASDTPETYDFSGGWPATFEE